MANILVYDVEAEELAKIAEANDMSVADVVERLMEYAEDMKADNYMD